ncbi:immunity 52 family protein [Corallococcus exiguus]|uniref:immunity 52 family protein n=1 Tax=Corallococcus exiguus TaxID=83462 RepID=UPI001560D800|nr:immunity 52 family protein [Corallococcus exiguus]NRD65239.1 immunity 52 family protein [Corallococcus exiguus]
MLETHYAGCYWLARQEPIDACARRLESFLEKIAPLETTWNRWHQTAATFEKARKRQVQPDATTLTKLLGQKNNRIGDGSRFWLWTGEDSDETSAFTGSCGGSSTFVSANCILNPLGQSDVANRVVTAPIMTSVVRAMALAWEPEFALATSSQHVDTIVTEQFPKLGTYGGWVTYLADFRGPVPPLPSSVQVEHVPDRGTLITLTQEKFTVSNPAHVALAADVQARLQAAGLLTPLRPWGT